MHLSIHCITYVFFIPDMIKDTRHEYTLFHLLLHLLGTPQHHINRISEYVFLLIDPYLQFGLTH